MIYIALKRLRDRPGLAFLSIIGVTLAVGLVVSIPVFAEAISFVMLKEELTWLSATDQRPPFSVRFSVLPAQDDPLSLERARGLEDYIAESVAAQTGLPLIGRHRQMEAMGMIVRTREGVTAFQNTRLTVLPGAASRLTILSGGPMSAPSSGGEVLDVWMHYTGADEAGFLPGELYHVYDARSRVIVPIRIAGIWQAADPQDTFWIADPDVALGRALLVREADYAALVEPVFEGRLRSVSWHLVFEHDALTPESVGARAAGLRSGVRIVEQHLTAPRTEGPLLRALDTAIQRESDLTVLLFVYSVPIVGFALYFLSLISRITVHWQRRETAQMISRGLRREQLLGISLIEAGAIVGLGVPLGILVGSQLARLMGYTESFVGFTWRAPLPVSARALNVPLVVATVSASILARLWPAMRSTGTSIVAYERRRARASQKPFWQRAYLDVLLVIPVVYAYRRLLREGTLVPSMAAGEGMTSQDPLLFLVPALFVLTLSLLLIRAFPILMRIGDQLNALGRRTSLYLAFRQLSRQSAQYTSALLLVITAVSLGGFMASVAASLDGWLADQANYAVGADVFIKQMYNPAYLVEAQIPSDGAWMLPVQTFRDLPRVTDAARVGNYPATIQLSSYQSTKVRYMGIDRLDLPAVLLFRNDFAAQSLGGLMNRLAAREDAVLLSERTMASGQFQVGDKVPLHITLVDLFDQEVSLRTDLTVAGTYRYFPTVYEGADGLTTVIGNLDFLFDQVGGAELHDTWLKIEPGAGTAELRAGVEGIGVYVMDWVEARELLAEELARAERIGTLGTLTIGFLAAAAFAGIGLLIYSYASLQERLFRFSVLRAVGLSLPQIVFQVIAEYAVLIIYGVVGGAATGAWASRLFIPFFQAADANVLRPPAMLPVIAWPDIGQIAGAFSVVLFLAQIAVIAAALQRGVFQALRMGDQE